MAKQRLFIHTIDVTFEQLAHHMSADILKSETFLDKSEEEQKQIIDSLYQSGHAKTHRIVSERVEDAVSYVLLGYQRRGANARNFEVTTVESHSIDTVIHIETHESEFASLFGGF